MDNSGFSKRELQIIADRLLPNQCDSYPWNEQLRIIYNKVMKYIDRIDAERECPDYNCMRGLSIHVNTSPPTE
jgi:hypothetical protein